MKYSGKYWNDIDEVLSTIPNIQDLNYSNILITGATGMIGSSVAELLFYLNREKTAKIKIYLAGRSKERMKERFYCFTEGVNFFFVPYDATVPAQLNIKVDYIIHGASNANPSVFVKEPVETMLANIIGTNSLLQFAHKAKIKRLLFLSSSEVYGKIEENRPYKEDDYGYVDLLNPRACYPSSKRAAETLCVSYGEEYGINTVIVRPGHIYGPTATKTDSRASAQFIQKACRGENIVMKSAGNQKRSYCYTLDCASAIITALINGKMCEAYNISNKDSIVSIREFAEEIARDRKIRVLFDNPSDYELKGYNLMSNSSLNAEKLENLGWKACFDLKRGIKTTFLNMEL